VSHGGPDPIAGLNEGDILAGKYRIEKVLGAGGMGVVVAARHIDLDQRVAIKCLLEHTRTMPEVVERFTREARAAAKIQGEHVARVIDVGRFDDGTPFMVMEYLQGHDLAAQLQQYGPLAVTDAVRYVLEACEAVVQAHALRIVHRDLKPANLFLAQQPGRRPIVKVLDFGISKVIEPGAEALTKTSSVMGTPFYMSPEQLLSSKNVDERSDIWALGVILYELLVGLPPFYGETGPEIIAQVLQNNPQPACARRPDLPPTLDAVIARCLRSKVEERFPNVADLAQALMPFASQGDRESVVAIASVLGIQMPPLGDGSAAAAAATAYSAAQPARFPSQAPAAATAHNLTLSAGRVSGLPRSRWGLFGIAGLGVAGAAIAAAALIRSSPAVHAPAVAAVAPVVDAVPPPASEPHPTPPVVTLTPADPPPPQAAAVAPAPGAPGPQAPAGAAGRLAGRHGAGPAGPAPAPSAHPAPSGATAIAAPAPAPPPAQPTPPPPANPTTPTNFLDMHIR
jgi:serine/threonine-protein kinase